jgi:hypothetical protein
MTTEYRYVRGDVRGRETRRLSQRFPLLSFRFEPGLNERLLDLCGDKNAFNLMMGRALFRHGCGVWGPISPLDRALNDYVFATRHGIHDGGRWVVSRHTVAGLLLDISSNLNDGETRVRRSPCLSVRRP